MFYGQQEAWVRSFPGLDITLMMLFGSDTMDQSLPDPEIGNYEDLYVTTKHCISDKITQSILKI